MFFIVWPRVGWTAEGIPLGAKIYPVRPGKLRLQSGAYKEVVESFRSLLSVPSDLFNQFYHQLLVRYADFVQLIPEQESLPSHSMLGNALKRTYTVLKTIIPMLQAREGKRFFQTSKGARLLYAIFSAMFIVSIGYANGSSLRLADAVLLVVDAS